MYGIDYDNRFYRNLNNANLYHVETGDSSKVYQMLDNPFIGKKIDSIMCGFTAILGYYETIQND